MDSQLTQNSGTSFIFTVPQLVHELSAEHYLRQFENRLLKKSCFINFTVANCLAFLVRFDIKISSDQKVFEVKVVAHTLTKLGF